MYAQKPEWKVIVELLEKVDPNLLNRITRRMFYYLYAHKSKKVDALVRELEPPTGDSSDDVLALYANVPNPRMELTDLRKFVERVFQAADEAIPNAEISKQISIWMAQERTRFLSMAVENNNIPLVEIKEALDRFDKISQEEEHISPDERMSMRVALIRRFLSNSLPYIRVAKQYITLHDFYALSQRVIGCAQGTGKLGGKSSGLILGYQIVNREKERHPELADVQVPQSWYLTSDSIREFIHYNTLEEIISLKYMEPDQIRAGYPFLQQLFKNSFFSSEIMNQLLSVLDQVGEKPIIVRSSSLLEDSFGAAFSGKYKSLFLSNQGSREDRLEALIDAVAEIYASVFSPDPITYRKERGLLDFNEEMGILIQEVVGTRVDKYFFPVFAGVAFGYNEFRWSPRIEKKDGMVRLVFGLGTRAVDRVGDDYPCLVSPGKPKLRVNQRPEDMVLYSQKKVDVLNLETNTFETLSVKELIDAYGTQIPGIQNIVSVERDGMYSVPFGAMFNPKSQDYLTTFQGLLERTPFLKQMKLILDLLEKTFGYPVDMEFAHDGKHFYFLQCRPQSVAGLEEAVPIPADIPPSHVVLAANKFVTSGLITNVEWIVYVVPEAYDSLAEAAYMRETANVVSHLNHLLPKRRFILVGPGRWGSRGDIKLGVPVKYSDINNAAMMVEVGCQKGDFLPELSFGTHFFQDLVESNIRYLPVYPDDDENVLNRTILEGSHNKLKDLLPEYFWLDHVVKVIHIPTLEAGATLTVAMDGHKEKALAYIEKAKGA
jgi:pyruvate, water dikinase